MINHSTTISAIVATCWQYCVHLHQSSYVVRCCIRREREKGYLKQQIKHKLALHIVTQLPYSGLFSRGKVFMNWLYLMFSWENFHKSLRALSAYQFQRTVVGFRDYFALATPYVAELIIAINSSQLVELLPFLLNMQGKTLDCLHKLLRSQYIQRSIDDSQLPIVPHDKSKQLCTQLHPGIFVGSSQISFILQCVQLPLG